jgi:hypothetical protein
MAGKCRYLQCNAECKIQNGSSSAQCNKKGLDRRFKLGKLIIYKVKIMNSNITPVIKFISEMSVERAHAVFLRVRVVLFNVKTRI